MTQPQGFYYPVLQPPDIESLALYFLTPLLAPTPIATRLPDDEDPNDTINGFLRIEAGGGVRLNYTQFNQTVQLHTYVPNEYEVQGGDIAGKAIAYMSSAKAITVNGCFIVDVPATSLVQRRSDPRVNLLRYMSWVTWTLDGQPVSS